jgi:hypothetical protein
MVILQGIPNYSIVGANNYDVNYSAHGSEDSILPENYEQTKNKMIPLGRFLLDITHDQAMLAKSQNLKI